MVGRCCEFSGAQIQGSSLLQLSKDRCCSLQQHLLTDTHADWPCAAIACCGDNIQTCCGIPLLACRPDFVMQERPCSVPVGLVVEPQDFRIAAVGGSKPGQGRGRVCYKDPGRGFCRAGQVNDRHEQAAGAGKQAHTHSHVPLLCTLLNGHAIYTRCPRPGLCRKSGLVPQSKVLWSHVQQAVHHKQHVQCAPWRAFRSKTCLCAVTYAVIKGQRLMQSLTSHKQ